jgi:catechol 2,3-dioxygenase-like lactoylglutathione lyase family enzyme
MIRGLHHIGISTGDLERALAFYRDLLGLETVFEAGWPAGAEVFDNITGLSNSSAKVAMLRAGNTMIELFQYESPPPRPGEPDRPVCDHGITHICLDVTDVEAEYQRLTGAGMRFHCPPQDLGFARATYGRDPDGNVVEILEIVDPASAMALDLP